MSTLQNQFYSWSKRGAPSDDMSTLDGGSYVTEPNLRMNTQNNPRVKRNMYKTHWEMRTKSECGGERTSSIATKSTQGNLDYAPKIMGTLT